MNERLAHLLAVRDAAIAEARKHWPKADEREIKVRAVIQMVRDQRPLDEIEFALGGMLPPVNIRVRVG